MAEDNSKKFDWASIAISFVAWLCVVAGILLVIYGYNSVKKEGGFTLVNLGTIGSFFQGSVASVWALAGLLFIYENPPRAEEAIESTGNSDSIAAKRRCTTGGK
jgi:vacuolar-type H+-ATPase subunit I/STV1